MPLVSRTFDQLIDFTRTTSATFVGSNGLIQSTPASRNLLTFTQEFDNAAWTKLNVTALPFNPATATLGAECVANGDFSSGASWSTPVAGASITSGALVFDGVTSITVGINVTNNTPVVPIVAGRIYLVTYTIIGGTTIPVSVGVGGNAGTPQTAAGTYSEYLVATNTTVPTVYVRTSTGARTGSIDNISVKEVTGGLITAPDGTSTADTLLASAGAAVHNVGQNNTVSGVACTWSVYAKAGTSSFVQLVNTANANTFANFNLATGAIGTVGSLATAAITSVGNGWYRCSITITPPSASLMRAAIVTSATAVFNESWTAAGTETIFLWGAQLELGSTASDYTRNYGGLFPPRFDYDPVTLAPRGLLIEEQRTNLLTYSEQFDNAAWSKTGTATITANSTTAPDGASTADTFFCGATAASEVRRSGLTVAATAHTYSVFAKKGAASFIVTQMSDGAGNFARQWFNLDTGVVGTVTNSGLTITSSSMTPLGDGWYRCAITLTFPSAISSATVNNFIGTSNGGFGGDATSTIFLWGAQLEAGAFATSYIPTVASQVTRTADAALIQAPNFAPWYNQSEGTFVVDADAFVNNPALTVYRVSSANDGTGNNRMDTFVYNGKWGGTAQVGGVSQADLQINASYTENTPTKTAFAYKTNDFAASVAGSAVATDTSGTVPTVDRFGIGVVVNSGYLNGHIRSIRYYPVRLSDAQLQALSA